MSKKLFIGNIDWGATEDDLRALFSEYGELEEVVIIVDKFSNRPKGFGFITFVNDEDATKAIAELNGHELSGRALVVNEARPKQPRQERY